MNLKEAVGIVSFELGELQHISDAAQEALDYLEGYANAEADTLWHDLLKNPDDLPEYKEPVLVAFHGAHGIELACTELYRLWGTNKWAGLQFERPIMWRKQPYIPKEVEHEQNDCGKGYRRA